jgi:hypothetical protein
VGSIVPPEIAGAVALERDSHVFCRGGRAPLASLVLVAEVVATCEVCGLVVPIERSFDTELAWVARHVAFASQPALRKVLDGVEQAVAELRHG